VTQLFELELAGGPAERSYRRLRPGIDEMPWDTLDASHYPPRLVDAARASWTRGAYQEYCTAAAFAELLRALLEARAPIDLIGMAGDFVADEIAHTELNARMAMVLGGAVAFEVDFSALTPPVTVSRDAGARLRAAELAVRYCCVGEAFSLPMLAGTLRVARHPLTRIVLERIVKDEAPHALLGWLFLEWADRWLSDDERRQLAAVALDALEQYAPVYRTLASTTDGVTTSEGFSIDDVHALGWMDSESYAVLARESVQKAVVTPLSRYGIDIPVAELATLTA
jgi:hypothetical protein